MRRDPVRKRRENTIANCSSVFCTRAVSQNLVTDWPDAGALQVRFCLRCAGKKKFEAGRNNENNMEKKLKTGPHFSWAFRQRTIPFFCEEERKNASSAAKVTRALRLGSIFAVGLQQAFCVDQWACVNCCTNFTWNEFLAQ